MTSKYNIFTLVLLLIPLLLVASTDASLYRIKGDDMFRETRYTEALDFYRDAIEYEDDATIISILKTKIEKTQHCESLMEKILQAHNYGSQEDEELYLRQLYSIHPSKLLEMKIKVFDEKHRELERLKKEKELLEQAEREVKERRIQEELARQRLKEEQRYLETLRQQEMQSWDVACKSNTIYAYNSFINKHPLSKNKSEALRRINELQEDEKWARTRKENNIAAYQRYINEGGKYTKEAYSHIDIIYWESTKEANDINAYQEYLSRTTPYTKSYSASAQERIQILSKQDNIIAEASLIQDAEEAYNKVQEARKIGSLNNSLEQKARKIEEPHAYKQAKGIKVSKYQKESYLSKYAHIAPEKHLKKIRTQVLKSYASTHPISTSSTSTNTNTTNISYKPTTSNTPKNAYSTKTTYTYSTKRATSNTNSTDRAFDSYYNQNGLIQYTWFSIDGYIGTSIGACLSIFEWRFGPIEFSPIVFGYNYPLSYTDNIESPIFDKIISRGIDDLFYQPTIRFYFPVKGSSKSAICLAGAPVFTLNSHTWFMAEIGYNYNIGILNGNLFLRYNGDFAIGIQFKLCHVF